MDANNLFLKTLRDIEKRLNDTDEYEILMIAGLLRKLLLDGDPLLDQVNREKKLKIAFTINAHKITSIPGMIFCSIEDAIDPETSPPHLCKTENVNKDKLLGTTIMTVNRTDIKIKDLISHIANVEGAIHAGKPRSEKEHVLQEIGKTLGIGGLPAGIRILKAISRVVLKGLMELKTEVENTCKKN